MRKVVLIGSHTFPVDAAIGTEIVEKIKEFGDDVTILTRGSEGFDQFIGHVCIILGIRCLTYQAAGGRSNWLRDIELVKDGDEILAFFDPDQLDDPQTGTAHVVESALTQNKPVRAYSVVNGALIWVGENE